MTFNNYQVSNNPGLGSWWMLAVNCNVPTLALHPTPWTRDMALIQSK